jgi:hypothetical protein
MVSPVRIRVPQLKKVLQIERKIEGLGFMLRPSTPISTNAFEDNIAVVERDFAWASRFRRLVKDYERLPATLAGLHFVAFACLFLRQRSPSSAWVHNTL